MLPIVGVPCCPSRAVPHIWVLWSTTYEDVNNDLRLVVNQVHALLDSALDVDVIDSTSVHEEAFTLPIVRREHEGDRG